MAPGPVVKGDENYQIGDYVPWNFSPGIVVASFLASLVGCILTVELLHRKQLGTGWAARLQLIGCAAAFGLIGIWCMHFIGERAIILGSGREELQLGYSDGFTLLSCVLPVLGLSFAFYIAELHIRNNIIRRLLLVASGFFAGLSIVGMHYCGNLGTTNYAMVYPPRYIVAACIIAIGDCIVALMLFFYLQEKWLNVLWKRLMCALLLSIGVCGMHYTASIGCAYRLSSLEASGFQRNVAVIVAAALCLLAAATVFAVIAYAALRHRQLAKQAQQVNLACAYFDKEGNLLVTNEGVLPSQKIVKRFIVQNFGEVFSTAHPTFHWIWKVSQSWGAVSDLVPRMRSHVRRLDPDNTPVGTSHSSRSNRSSFYEVSFADEGLLFQEGFCVASADIADRLHIKLEQLGTLYDKIVGTGFMPKNVSTRQLSQSDAASIASHSGYERGQVLYFTKILTPDEIAHFLASGLRLAPPSRVQAMIARTMQVPIQYVTDDMTALYDYAADMNKPDAIKLGTYFTCFAALGRLSKRFDVLVSRVQGNQLPDVQLSERQLNAAQLKFLRQYDGWSAGTMVEDLKAKRVRAHLAEGEHRGFIMDLVNSLCDLSEQISEQWFNDLAFNARPIVTHYGTARSAGTAMILGLTTLLDIHQSSVRQPKRLKFVPLDFLRVRSGFYPGSPGRTRFRAQVHREFASILIKPIIVAPSEDGEDEDETMPSEKGGLAKTMQVMVRKLSRSIQTDDTLGVRGDSISERDVVHSDSVADVLGERKAPRSDSAAVAPHLPSTVADFSPAIRSPPMAAHGKPSSSSRFWGGILATTDTVIEAHDIRVSPELELVSMQSSITANARNSQGIEFRTYVDALYEQAKVRGIMRPGPGSRKASMV